MNKLHKQFGHYSKSKFILFMKDAKADYPEMEKHIDEIIEKCEGCLIQKRKPDKPVVLMPMAREFNEKLAIDLKVLSNPTGYVLHMIDMWSRYSVSTPLTRKLPNQVIHQVMNSWIRYFGIPGAVLNDNGGEFTAEEVRDMKSVLNIVDLTTGAESPWQNGLCERNHAIVDNMWTRLKEDYPGTPADVLLGWANMARNSMQMVYGFSPNQLVFGSNPNLPNVMNEGLPALEGKSFSETLNHHLDVLHSARKAFTESESSDRVRKALRRKVCSNNTVYHNGDLVWYRRREGDRAMGPGKVVFQDGKVIFIRHGSTYVRVSSNRIVKRGKEFGRNEAVMNTTAPPVTDEEESKNPEPEPLVQVDEAIDETEGREPEEADGLGPDQETEHTATDPVEDDEHNEAEDSIELEENIDAQNQADNDHQVTSPWTTRWSPPPLARELGRTLPSSEPNHQDNTKQSDPEGRTDDYVENLSTLAGEQVLAGFVQEGNGEGKDSALICWNVAGTEEAMVTNQVKLEGVIDTACTSNAIGAEWWTEYEEAMDEEGRNFLVKREGKRRFHLRRRNENVYEGSGVPMLH